MSQSKAGRRRGGRDIPQASWRALRNPPFFGHLKERTKDADIRYFGVACETPSVADPSILSRGSTTVFPVVRGGVKIVPQNLYVMSPAKRSDEDSILVDEARGNLGYRMLLSKELYHIDPDKPLFLVMTVREKPVRLNFNGAYRFQVGPGRVAEVLPLLMPTPEEPEKETHVSIRLEDKPIGSANVRLTRVDNGIIFNYFHRHGKPAESARMLKTGG